MEILKWIKQWKKIFESLEIEVQKPTYIQMKTSYLIENTGNKLMGKSTKYRKVIGVLTGPDIYD